MAKVKIGCGWYVLAVLGVSIWAANKWAPNHIARAKAAIAAKMPKMPAMPWSRSASPSPAPTPQLATPAPTAPTPESATPSPEPTLEPTAPPSEEPDTPPTDTGGDMSANVTTEDVRVGSGREAKIGQTVRIRCALLGSGGETLGGSSDFLFMLGADEVASGLDKAVLGMKSGGKRKANIPAEAAKGLLPPGVDAEGGPLAIEIELAEVL